METPIFEYNKLTHYNRRTGLSTGLAIATIGRAILNPGECISIVDHFGTNMSNRALFCTIIQLVDKLGLERMQFNKTKLTLEYKKY